MTPQDAIKWADSKMLEIVYEFEVTKSEAGQKRLNEEYQALTVLKSCAESRVPIVVTGVAIYANGNQSVLIETVDRSGRPVECWADTKSIEEVKEQEK